MRSQAQTLKGIQDDDYYTTDERQVVWRRKDEDQKTGGQTTSLDRQTDRQKVIDGQRIVTTDEKIPLIERVSVCVRYLK